MKAKGFKIKYQLYTIFFSSRNDKKKFVPGGFLNIESEIILFKKGRLYRSFHYYTNFFSGGCPQSITVLGENGLQKTAIKILKNV